MLRLTLKLCYLVSFLLHECVVLIYSTEENSYELKNRPKCHIDLSSKLYYFQKVRSNRGTIVIHLCSDFQGDACASSAVCLFNLSTPMKGFGVKSNMKILKEGKDVKFTYTGKICEALSAVGKSC